MRLSVNRYDCCIDWHRQLCGHGRQLPIEIEHRQFAEHPVGGESVVSRNLNDP
jgi:hypothetical protein